MAFERISLNIIPEGEMPVFHASQFDAGRPIIIDLYNGDDAYTPAAGVTFELHCRKVDDNIVTLDTYEVDGNGTEEFVDGRTVEMPVGHDTFYIPMN